MLGRSALVAILGAALHASPTMAQSNAPGAPWLLLGGGFGGSVTLVDNANGVGTGGYVAAEILSTTADWLLGSLYGGLLLTWPDDGCGQGVAPCDISARIFFLGVKARLMAPIPWVGPFFDIGVGLSFGTLTTLNGAVVQAEARGVIPHWLWGLGLALGPHHEFSLSLQYLEHTRGQQSSFLLGAGYAFPL